MLRTSQTRSSANDSPNTAVARTCQYTAGWNDQSRRTTVLPGCGPAAVASVPLTISTHAASPTSSPSRAPSAAARARARPLDLDRERDAERQHDDREQEVREHEPRVQMEMDRDRPERRLQRACRRRSANATQRRRSTAAPERADERGERARIVRNATTRFPNSMYEWKLLGSKWCCSQPGQCSQPRPEPVRRTVAPVATITTSIARWPRPGAGTRERERRSRARDSGCAVVLPRHHCRGVRRG